MTFRRPELGLIQTYILTHYRVTIEENTTVTKHTINVIATKIIIKYVKASIVAKERLNVLQRNIIATLNTGRYNYNSLLLIFIF